MVLEQIQNNLTAEEARFIEHKFSTTPSLRVAWSMGQDERQNPGYNVFDFYTPEAATREDEQILIKDLFFLPKEGNWIENWINFSTPEEVENQFAFYLGANYINPEEYLLLLGALKLSRQIHGNEKRRDGLRRSLNGHILPGMRFIFDNRHEIIDSILNEEAEGELSFFERLFVFMGHDWMEDQKDDFLNDCIAQFPTELVEKIRNLSHFKSNGITREVYADGINGAGKVEKFVKMVDRMMNLLDDRGKTPSLDVITSPERLSKVEGYLEETKHLYKPIFEEAGLPLFYKFEEVVNYVETDVKTSRDYLTFVREKVLESLGLPKNTRPVQERFDEGTGDDHTRRDRSPIQKLAHIERMIKDLEQNSAKYGILCSTGNIASIYFHDLIKERSFLDKMNSSLKEFDHVENGNPRIAKLLRYSLALANSARAIENKSVILPTLVNRLYEDQPAKTRELLSDIFAKPSKDPSANTRQLAQKDFAEDKKNLYNLVPAPDKINFNTFRKILNWDIEGALLRTLEVIDNINHPPNFDKTYAWRNCQEALYLLLPLLETFGLKGAAKELKNTILTHIHEILYGKDDVTSKLRKIENASNQQEILELEKIINRVVGGEAVIDFDVKGAGSALQKYQEEGRTAITDLRRCRVILPPMSSDAELLESALSIISSVVDLASGEDLQILINRPSESVGSEAPKLPLRISLDMDPGMLELYDILIHEMKESLNIPEIENLHQFVSRRTGYKDVKIVFQITPKGSNSDDPIFYEMIIVDSSRHQNNVSGEAGRIFRMIRSGEGGKERRPTEEELTIARGLSERNLAYTIYSHSGLNLSLKSQLWLQSLGRRPDFVHSDEDAIERLRGVLTHRLEYIV